MTTATLLRTKAALSCPRLLSVCALALGWVGCASSAAPADLVLTGGNIYTVAEAMPSASAVAIRAGELVYVGDDEGAARFVGPSTQVVDLEGRLVLPGFIDTHAHPVQAAGLAYALRLSSEVSPDDVVLQVEAYAARYPDRTFILGFGFDETAFGPDGPRRELLDAVVSDRPVILVDEGGHSAWVNTAALDAFGIDATTPDPIPGAHFYQRDPDGTPTGWLVESQAFFPHLAALGAFDAGAAARSNNLAYTLFSSVGVTTVYDAGMSSFEAQALEAVAQMDREGLLRFRLVVSHQIQHPNQVPGAIARFQEMRELYGSDRLRVGMIKIHNDGTTEARTAAYLEPYTDVPGSSGAVLLEPAILDPFVVAADGAGIDIHIHAIGDRTVREALDAIALARAANPGADTRHTLAHVEQITDADVPRFAELDVTAQTTPYWCSVDYTGQELVIGPERMQRLYRIQDLLEAGARVTFGSDFPATGSDLLSMSPLWNIEAGATRQAIGDPDAPILGGVAARTSVADLVRGYTLDAAYQLHMEDEVGSIEVGKRADLVVLGGNIFEMPLHEIHQTSVDVTMLDGVLVTGALP
ncbi:MAG: amidohydrolase [Sandaracinaceae bacterium]|nr:amidohydrolase [Sandaracinaceae bacterium]